METTKRREGEDGESKRRATGAEKEMQGSPHDQVRYGLEVLKCSVEILKFSFEVLNASFEVWEMLKMSVEVTRLGNEAFKLSEP